MRFTKRFANGHVATSDVASSQPSALLDLGQPNRYNRPPGGLILSGTARLVTPDGIVDPARKGGTSYQTDMPWTIIKVQLDSAVFNDGEAVGPDQLNVIKGLKAHIDAQQDLTEEISERIAKGEQLRDILHDLQQKAALSNPDLSEVEVQTMTTVSSNKTYSVIRQLYLNELSATATNVGDEIAFRRLQQLRYVARPNIHRQSGGN
jgi:hypothetical protein